MYNQVSAHYKFDRKDREKRIKSVGEGVVINKFYVDRGHPDGAEIHCISDTGIVTVYNAITHKLVTRFICNPKRCTAYYKGKPPRELMKQLDKIQYLNY